MKNKAIDWYIKGKYHCDKCPYCWDDYSEYTGDGDCGCYIFGDLRESCRLIPPIRFLLGWGKKKKAEYYWAHLYDNFEERDKEQDKLRKEFNTLIKNHIFKHYALYSKDSDGNAAGDPIDASAFCESLKTNYFWWDCKFLFSPPKVPVPLKKQWTNLIKETWHRFIGIFKPYFCK